MAYYSILAVTPITNDWIPEYLEPASALVEKHGGRYLARTGNHECLEGVGDDIAIRVLIEWPSKEAAKGFMQDPEYAPLLEARQNGSDSHHILIEGKDDLG